MKQWIPLVWIILQLSMGIQKIEGQDAMTFSVKMKIDLGKDLGQNRGTLFEATDKTGHVVAGAGYQGVYNTEVRSDQRVLQFYIKPKTPTYNITALPRVNSDAGVYLHTFNNQLFARSHSGKDPNLYRWHAQQKTWVQDLKTTPFSQHIGHHVLSVTKDQITYHDQVIYKPTHGIIGAHYYANGFFLFRHSNAQSNPPHNQIVATPWQPGDKIADEKNIAIDMKTDYEFVYAYGHLGTDILAITNIGGIYRFNGQTWATLREPIIGVSFQIYSILTYHNRLLLGHYPTGELYEYANGEIKHLKDWPPVMPGVSTQAREAQTMAIFGGNLYVGVWPWAELWCNRGEKWSFVQRMFPHPTPTNETTHPYENETKALDEVINRWGQRITSLVPHQDGLFLSTSAKISTPYEEKFTFLANDKWKDYGTVYHIQIPGHLSAHTQWVDGPTLFEFKVTSNHIQILQDGKVIEQTASKGITDVIPQNIQWGHGVFGPLNGHILKHEFKKE